MERYRSEMDVLLLRGPTPLLPAIPRAAADVPVVLMLVADYLPNIKDLPHPAWRKWAIRLWAELYERRQRSVSAKNLTFVNSGRLYEKLRPYTPHLIQTKTTTIRRSDFYERDDTCRTAPYRVLYTGRIIPSKGIVDLVDAIELLVNDGRDVVLDLVGWFEKDEFLKDLQERARRANMCDRIQFHGYASIGPELFAHYQNADVFVISSRSDFEGVPRTLWEAMANSLPVVATAVGGIPFVLSDRVSALLVPPRCPARLAEAVSEVLDRPRLRREMIREGRLLAQENTLTARGREMIAEIEEWLNERGRRPAPSQVV